MTATETTRPAWRDSTQVAPIQRLGPIAFDGTIEDGLHPFVNLLAQPGHLALGDAAHVHRLDQVVDRTRRNPLYGGVPDHGGLGFPRNTTRFRKPRNIVAALRLPS